MSKTLTETPAYLPLLPSHEAMAAGRRHFEAGRWLRALAAFNHVREGQPHHVAAHYMALQCHEKLGDHDEVSRIGQTLYGLLCDNPKARDMFEKYGDQFRGLSAFEPDFDLVEHA